MLTKFLLNDVLNFNALFNLNLPLKEKVTGVLNFNSIESAVYAPFQTFDGNDVCPNIFDKAAKLACYLNGDHGFIDGNKRAAIHSMIVYLFTNGFDITETINTDTVKNISKDIAERKLLTSELSQLLSKCSKKFKKATLFCHVSKARVYYEKFTM